MPHKIKGTEENGHIALELRVMQLQAKYYRGLLQHQRLKEAKMEGAQHCQNLCFGLPPSRFVRHWASHALSHPVCYLATEALEINRTGHITLGSLLQKTNKKTTKKKKKNPRGFDKESRISKWCWACFFFFFLNKTIFSSLIITSLSQMLLGP